MVQTKAFDHTGAVAEQVRANLRTALGNLPRTTATIPGGTIVLPADVAELQRCGQLACLLADRAATFKAR